MPTEPSVKFPVLDVAAVASMTVHECAALQNESFQSTVEPVPLKSRFMIAPAEIARLPPVTLRKS
jgi:hypothetical protein